jgi:hypothetical protein
MRVMQKLHERSTQAESIHAPTCSRRQSLGSRTGPAADGHGPGAAHDS